MKILILGIARSGTTSLYSTIQKIMLDNHNEVEFVYEPFLWDKDTFNGLYNNVEKQFRFVNSISTEGIYNHLSLPLFINSPKEYFDNEYLQKIFSVDKKSQNILVKAIRANGRLSLIKELVPELKVVFIMRNPIDSINSILLNFSYFGGEFHKDDFPRFIEGINKNYTLRCNPESFEKQHSKEILYWYYMNQFAIESFSHLQIDPFFLVNEEYVENREKCLKDLCKYLGYRYKDKYRDFSERKQGKIASSFNVGKDMFELSLNYFDKYQELIRDTGSQYKIDKSLIVKKYTIIELKQEEEDFHGINPIVIRKGYQNAIINLRNTEENLDNTIRINDELKTINEKNEKRINTLRNNVQEKIQLIELAHLKDEIITQLENSIAKKERIIQLKDQTLKQRDKLISEMYNSYSWKIGWGITRVLRFFFSFAGKQKFRLIISLYNETEPSRVAELLYCLEVNNNHELIEDIHIFYDTSKDDDKNIIYNEIIKNKNVKILKISGKPTFKQLFQYANDNLPDTKVIISNSDIYFNDTLMRLRKIDISGSFCVLTRWNDTGNGRLLKQKDRRSNLPAYFSADTWIFQTPLTSNFYSNYKLGSLFCDVFLNTQLFKSGLQIFNPCYDVQACHLQKGMSVSLKCFEDGNIEIYQKTKQEEYIRNGNENPESGVIWSYLFELNKKINNHYRRGQFNVIVDVTNIKIKMLNEISPIFSSMAEKYNCIIWFFDAQNSHKKYRFVKSLSEPGINYTGEYIEGAMTLVPGDDFSLSNIMKRNSDIYIKSCQLTHFISELMALKL